MPWEARRRLSMPGTYAGAVFRLYDTRTGRPEPVRPARPGQLQIYLASPAQLGRIRSGDLRAALVADLIRRVAERHHLYVTAWLWQPSGSPNADAGMPAACEQLNIHPAQPASRPPGPLDVTISAPEADSPAGIPGAADGGGAAGTRGTARSSAIAEAEGAGKTSGRRWAGDARLRPAAVRPDDVLPGDLAARALDPLALRLALLRHHHQQAATLGWDVLAGADEALRSWRRQVAEWALAPSKPMCAQYAARVTGAFDDDLATPAALAALDALSQDQAIPPGSKFEAFAYADQLLGLDLARDVGR
jgi:hypothetical protein